MAVKKTTQEKIDAIPSLNRALSEINRKYGEGTIKRLNAKEDQVLARISTGITSLDTALDGGFPLGRIVELYGIPSSGKSLITLLTIVQAQQKGLECVYIDAEGSFDTEFARKLGVDIDKLIVMKTGKVAEDIFDIIAYIEKSQPAIVVVDSVAALITEVEMEASLKDQQMAIKARVMSKALAKINTLNEKTLFLFINQVRDTMAMYGAKETTPGGRALGHYATIRLRVHQPSEKIHKDDKKTAEIIGQIAQFRVTKSKASTPFREGTFKFYYEDFHVES